MSWFVAALSVGVLLGVALAPLTEGHYNDISWLVIGLSLFVTGTMKRPRYMLVLVVMGGVMIGLWRGCAEFNSTAQYKKYYGQKVIVTGRVTEDTSYGPRGDLRIRVGDVVIDSMKLPSTIWVSTNNKQDIKRGDTIILQGTLGEGFGNIPASMFRASVLQIQRPVPGDIGRRVRDWFAVGVHAAMPAAQADLALAYLVGQKLSMSEALGEQLRTVGLIHAVVASGYHLTVLMSVMRRLFVRISKYLTAMFSVGMIGGFIMITGFSPSMTRAGLVSGLSLAAWYYGRVIHPLVLLPFAAGLTVLYKPEYMWGDVGWYLSFAAFAGVIILAPLLHHYFWGVDKQPSVMREVLVATLAAQMTTLPITMLAFGYYSVYALLANALVVPLIPLTMLLTFISGAAGLLAPAIASIIGFPVVVMLNYMIWVVERIAELPSAKIEVTLSYWSVALGYAALLGVIIYLWRVTKHNFRRDILLQKDF